MFDSLKKVILITTLIVVCLGCISAKGSYSPSINGYLQGSFIFPTADYLKTYMGKKLPAMRTSASYALDVMAANFSINNLEIGAGFSAMRNTRSLDAMGQFIRSYAGIGPTLGVQYHFCNGFALGSKFRFLFCSYAPLKNKFDTMELEVSPSIDLVREAKKEVTLMFPVTVAYKNDFVAVKLGVGLDLQLNFAFGGKHEEN